MSNITAGGVQFIITVRQYGLYCSAPKQNWGLQDTHSIATTHCTAYKLLSISMQQSKDSSSTQPLFISQQQLFGSLFLTCNRCLTCSSQCHNACSMLG